jgi:hypothetical protein
MSFNYMIVYVHAHVHDFILNVNFTIISNNFLHFDDNSNLIIKILFDCDCNLDFYLYFYYNSFFNLLEF